MKWIFIVIVLLSQIKAAILNVPATYSNLESAISAANSGDIITLAAGTYTAPVNGFRLENNTKNLTIQAEEGATATIDGGGNRNLVWFGYDSGYSGTRGTVLFKDLSFSNGYSGTDGVAGGITLLYGATAKFKNCTFQNNKSDTTSTGGGAMLIGNGSTAYLLDSNFTANSAKNEGGAISVKSISKLYVHQSTFSANRTNLPGHRDTAAGGGIHIGDSQLKVSNSRFENNQAGYVGGAIYAIGTYDENWGGVAPGADVVISNCTFVLNRAKRDSGVIYSFPTEAGAVHVENKTQLHVDASRFEKNDAMHGGAINIYRASGVVTNSVFLGNYAAGAVTLEQKSVGGTFSVISNDANDASTMSGTINRPSGSLTISDSYIQGRYDTVTIAADVGGCLYAAGDANRLDGQNGVSQEGDEQSNRATVSITNVAFNDCDVVANGVVGSSSGGAIAIDLTHFTMSHSMIINSDASGVYGSGGGLWIANRSAATVTSTTVSSNSAEDFGGGVYVDGSEITLTDAVFTHNAIINQDATVNSVNYGAALLTASNGHTLTGTVSGCTFSNNSGLAVFEFDHFNGPIVDLVYNSNDFYVGATGEKVFQNSVAGGQVGVSNLNSLIVDHNTTLGLPSVDKSAIANTEFVDSATQAMLLVVPSAVYDTNAPSDPAPPTVSYVVYGWNGTSATLNGSSLSETSGFITTNVVGTSTLHVTGSSSADSSDTVSKGTASTFSYESTKSVSPAVLWYLLL